MATTVAKSGQPVRNNGAVLPRAGNFTSGNITSAPDNLTQGYTNSQGNGPISKTGANIGTLKAITDNTFARPMVAGQFLMTGYGFINGVSVAWLNGGAADFGRRSIHYKENRRTYHITSWNYLTGAATKDSPTTDSFGTDDAARPSRAIPGEFIFTDHGLAQSGALAVPLMDDYEARTSQ